MTDAMNNVYREIILDHYKTPRNKHELKGDHVICTEGNNPLCGDRIELYVDIDEEKVSRVAFTGNGCSISQASSSMMTEAAVGKTIDELRVFIDEFKNLMDIHSSKLTDDLTEEEALTQANSQEANKDVSKQVNVETDMDTLRKFGDLSALQGVVRFPVRIKCATLAWNTLAQALNDYQSND